MKNAGRSLSMNLTAPLALAGGAAVNLAVDFDSSMTKIVSLVGIAGDEVNGMRTEVLKLSGETAKSPKELADGLFVLTSAGLRGDDALSALEQSAKASAAGLGETNDIARAVAGAMNAYGTDVIDASKATDIITATARAGNFEVSQFSGALGKVLPFAKQAGASLEDVGGAVALLTRTNGDAAVSVTQVQALLRAFVVPTAEATKALDSVGLSAADMRAAISTDGLPAALDMLEDKLGGNREQLGRLLGSSEASSAAFQILDADAESLAGTFGVTNDAIGMTDDAFATTAETSGFKMQTALNELKIVAVELGDVLVPFVEKFAEVIGVVTDKFKALTPEQKDMVVKVGLIIAAIGPMLIIIGAVITTMGHLATAIKTVGIVLQFLALNPIGAVIVGIAALIALIVIIVKNWDDIKEAASNAWARIKEIVGGAKDFIIDKLRSLGEWIVENHPLLKLFRAVRDFAPTVLKWFKDLGGDIMDGLKDGIVGAATGFVTAIKDAVKSGVDAVKKLLKIQSPSRVFMGIGENVVAGYINGVKSMGAELESTVGDMALSSTVAFNGAVTPSASSATSMTPSSIYNINVNAGMGADGAVIGREIVDAIKRYERTSGPVFASA
jgi:TP901 family phage tail tape measure protein